jgi:predicted pyridoxine 5'-phosphate oxidase superfamily flavin-nucleotide-binding protein
MGHRYFDIAATPSVVEAQIANGSRGMYAGMEDDPSPVEISADVADFIAGRDSFYMATVSETGWPYVQHRGGPPGFLKVLDATTVGFADFRGNRQYISLGNASANNRAALILMDYPHRRRLKIYARIEARDLKTDPELARQLALPGYRALPERAILLHVEAFDRNCPQYITPRFTNGEIEAAIEPMRLHLAALEAENQALRAQLATTTGQVPGHE